MGATDGEWGGVCRVCLKMGVPDGSHLLFCRFHVSSELGKPNAQSLA